MYIKYKSFMKNIIIINVNISSCKNIFVEDSILKIDMGEDIKETVNLKFEDNEKANLALQKMWITLGLKAPQNNILDLINLNYLEESQMTGLTLQDIADKFKLDIREMAIVSDKKPISNIVQEVKIEEGET